MDDLPPQISIITAVFNRVDTIVQAMESVGAQSWLNVEHIVFYGAPTDGTLSVLEAIAKLISEKDSGIYDALNKGLACAADDVVGLMHSDEFYADESVLEKVANAFSYPTAGGVYGDLDYVAKDEPERIIRSWRSGPYDWTRLAWGWMPPHPTLFLRRSVIDECGGFDTSYQIAADYDAMLRYLSRGRIELAYYIPEVLVKMRMGGESNPPWRVLYAKAGRTIGHCAGTAWVG